MKKIFLLCLLISISVSIAAQSQKNKQKTLPKSIIITKERLKDKIMGGWAGQTIGVTFGGPYEFNFSGSFIQDYQPLTWYDGYLKKTMVGNPGLYDDLYVDLTFVDVFERLGLEAPVDSFAYAFANAGYMLWHANQAARYNILNGIKAPQSGHWINNPHAEDIDYQIEADYAGLMSPGMPNTASAISDKIGHIMNCGDGWYGGVYIGALYALSFVSDDIHFIAEEALKTIPQQSTYYKCISDVIKWQKQYPSDWHQSWLELQKKWSSDVGCPDGVFSPFDIDAKINSAYVMLGLLYGDGNFTKTLEISTRAGQDADCNPSSAGGILGAMLGYGKIPSYWKMGLKDAEDIKFKYTDISLNKAYELSFKHALENIRKNGGAIDGEMVKILVQKPQPVKLEQNFTGLYPIEKRNLFHENINELAFEFEGTGFMLKGEARKKNSVDADYVFEVELNVDGKKLETTRLPTNFTTRRYDLVWKYPLPRQKHTILLKVLNPDSRYELRSTNCIIFSDRPAKQNQ